MSQYYAAIIRATRSSARALQTIARTTRQIRATDDIDVRARLFRQHDMALRRYHVAQAILASHPLSADDIAARQADYPAPRR